MSADSKDKDTSTSPQTPSYDPLSKSEPNIQPSMDIDDDQLSSQQNANAVSFSTNNSNDNASSVPADYVSSTISGAYTYMTSFYSSPDKQIDPISQITRTHSRSLSEIDPQLSKNKTKSNDKPSNDDTDNISSSQPSQAAINASIADRIKYPMKFDESNASQSDLHVLLDEISTNGLQNDWTQGIAQPIPNTVQLRSASYKMDRKKVSAQAPLFRLAHVQAFTSETVIDHLAQNPVSWFKQNIAADDLSCFVLIVHLQVQSVKTSFVSYHVLESDSICGYNANGTPIIKDDMASTKLLDTVLNCNDKKVRDNKLKLIPRIVSGPYAVRKMVENRPVLLGNKVPQIYFRGANYFEIDAKVDESLIAASIIKICYRFAKKMVVDMAWTIQGDEGDELPERLFCGVTVHNMDFAKCRDLATETQKCTKLKYKNEHKQTNVSYDEDESKDSK